ncbi:unnamed protein product [Caenorhabditis sp. 36 PRJEB53466]|nr:unnamed protein product [Caenorhabditis sp. 36 PRJEB53466]
MTSDKANQSRPFVLYNTFGEFLRSSALFFLSIALICACFGTTGLNNAIVIHMIINALVIYLTLEFNSKTVFFVFGCLTFISVIGQIAAVFLVLLSMRGVSTAGTSKTVISLVAAFFIIFIVLLVVLQLFCSAAMIKLSEVIDDPKHVEKEKASTRRERRRRSDSDSFSSSPSSSESIKSIEETHTCSSEC